MVKIYHNFLDIINQFGKGDITKDNSANQQPEEPNISQADSLPETPKSVVLEATEPKREEAKTAPKKEANAAAPENNDPPYRPPSVSDEFKAGERISPRIIEEEMKSSYLNYAMSVIIGRALPDVRDGLKPVQRRILFAMSEMGILHNKPFKKSARIVGETLGKFHPHGDTAVYDALARLTQDFSLRYPLIQGQGNFGSIDGDSPAAMRYTEARLKKISEDIIQDINKETVEFVPNFDGSLNEPTVLPAKVPNLLVNGSSGIAVGMATNIPPHNITEVCDCMTTVIDNPQISIKEVNNIIKGPDFPTGATICGRKGVMQAYATGRGKIRVRAKVEIEEKKSRNAIIIKEVPYQINKAQLVEQIADLVKQKVVLGISDLRDESDRKGIRVVIELKKEANPEIVLNQLYKHSRMQVTFGIIMLALVDRTPKVLNLKQMMQHYIRHRKDVVTKRTQYDLKKAEAKAHILHGLKIALENIDNVIKIIKAAKAVDEARKTLISSFSLTEIQSQAILDMKLQRLTSLEQEKLKEELKQTLALIEELKGILASEQKIIGIIKQELAELKKEYGDERKTGIIDSGDEDLEVEDLIEEEEMVITVSHSGYIKRLSIDTYKQQRRGGKGVIGAGKKEEDFIEHLFIANTHSDILFFTDKGQVHWLKVHKVPEASRQAKGTAIVNLIEVGKDEKVTAMIPIKEFDDKHYLLMATKKGVAKKTNLMAYSRPRAGGIKAIVLNENDVLVNVKKTHGKENIIIATKNGMAVKFHENDVRPVGRNSRGVRGIRLRGDDEVIGMTIAKDEKTLLTVTENGYGKRTEISEYRLINRGGSGVINIQCSERNGKVVSIKSVTKDDDLVIISRNGIVIRVPAKDISVIGRNTQGVRLMKMEERDVVVAAARVIEEKPEEDSKVWSPPQSDNNNSHEANESVSNNP